MQTVRVGEWWKQNCTKRWGCRMLCGFGMKISYPRIDTNILKMHFRCIMNVQRGSHGKTFHGCLINFLSVEQVVRTCKNEI